MFGVIGPTLCQSEHQILVAEGTPVLYRFNSGICDSWGPLKHSVCGSVPSFLDLRGHCLSTRVARAGLGVLRYQIYAYDLCRL